MPSYLAYWPFDPDRPDWIYSSVVMATPLNWRSCYLVTANQVGFPWSGQQTTVFSGEVSPLTPKGFVFSRFSSNRNKPINGGKIKTLRAPGSCRVKVKKPSPNTVLPSDGYLTRYLKKLRKREFFKDRNNPVLRKILTTKYYSESKTPTRVKPTAIGQSLVRVYDPVTQKVRTISKPIFPPRVQIRKALKDRNSLLPNGLNYQESWLEPGSNANSIPSGVGLLETGDVLLIACKFQTLTGHAACPPGWHNTHGPDDHHPDVTAGVQWVIPVDLEDDPVLSCHPYCGYESTEPVFEMIRDILPPLEDISPSETELIAKHSELVEELTNKSLSKLYTKLNNSTVNLAIAFAEGGKTLQTLSDLVTRLTRLFEALKLLKRGKVEQASKLVKGAIPLSAKGLANDFLAYRYGISPLVQDIQGSAIKLAEWLHSTPKVDAKSSASHRSVTDESYVAGIDNSISVTVTKTLRIDIKHKSMFSVESPNLKRLSEVGFTNPFSVAWELIPFSFVIDWISPIGNFLESLSSIFGLRITEVTRTVFIRETTEVDVFHLGTGLFSQEPDVLEKIASSFRVQNVQVVRELIDLPLAPIPRFKNPFSTGHLANAVALFIQKLKK